MKSKGSLGNISKTHIQKNWKMYKKWIDF
jgi:hypothetical protein